MSSKNHLGIEGNALNLSLTGSQLSQRSVNSDRNVVPKKSQSVTNRISSARASNNSVKSLKFLKNLILLRFTEKKIFKVFRSTQNAKEWI